MDPLGYQQRTRPLASLVFCPDNPWWRQRRSGTGTVKNVWTIASDELKNTEHVEFKHEKMALEWGDNEISWGKFGQIITTSLRSHWKWSLDVVRESPKISTVIDG